MAAESLDREGTRYPRSGADAYQVHPQEVTLVAINVKYDVLIKEPDIR